MLRIPPDSLAADVLDALIEEFVSRDGTDLTETTRKAAQVRAQLRSGEAFITYDDQTETANIVSKSTM
jgi:uncharacterized protein YheU (UPF0270 family)